MITEEEIARLSTGLETMAALFRHWDEYNVAARAREGLTTEPDTHLIAVPPEWPRHGTLRAWRDLMEEASKALALVQPAIDAAVAGDRERCAKVAERFMEAALKCDRCGDVRTTYVPGGCTGEVQYRGSDEFKRTQFLNSTYEAMRYFEKHLCNPREMGQGEMIAAIAAAIRSKT